METPIVDFVRRYAESGVSRLHMPGHKGCALLGPEALDLTEIAGADELCAPEGIIARSEENASALFGSGHTFYAAGGSSQCIRAMVLLARIAAPDAHPYILAARNVHSAFLSAVSLADVGVRWLWPEEPVFSLCSCPVTPERLRRTLASLPERPAAVYLTSPDYLGSRPDLRGLADATHEFGVPLLVDNAHGAYLRFLSPSEHPLDLGADLCCDSAHKTLPCLTGGAYLHAAASAPSAFRDNARRALNLFGSSSPSYLILQSLDLCNRLLSEDYPARLRRCIARLDGLRGALRAHGWRVLPSDPLRLTIDAASSGTDGLAAAEMLRRGQVECEYADRENVVLMATPYNRDEDLSRIEATLGHAPFTPAARRVPPPMTRPEAVLTPRAAMLAPQEEVSADAALGRVLADSAAAFPPEVPVAVAGERINAAAAALFAHYGITRVRVVREEALK